MPSNFERMLTLIDEVFNTRDDPNQLQVDEVVIQLLNQIHPATLAEYNEGEGPCVWILIIPTTTDVMRRFITGEISEQLLLELTEPGQTFEAVYLCSATVLPEYRRKGFAKKKTMESIAAMCVDHPIKYLYVWPFTPGGEALAEEISREAALPLLKRIHS